MIIDITGIELTPGNGGNNCLGNGKYLDENGKPDFESVKALDIEFFNKQLLELLDGKKVNLPTFNFVTGKREFKGNYLQLGQNDIIIVEGLHALNDELTMAIDKNKNAIE